MVAALRQKFISHLPSSLSPSCLADTAVLKGLGAKFLLACCSDAFNPCSNPWSNTLLWFLSSWSSPASREKKGRAAQGYFLKRCDLEMHVSHPLTPTGVMVCSHTIKRGQKCGLHLRFYHWGWKEEWISSATSKPFAPKSLKAHRAISLQNILLFFSIYKSKYHTVPHKYVKLLCIN
jgi:hypothetical protein